VLIYRPIHFYLRADLSGEETQGRIFRKFSLIAFVHIAQKIDCLPQFGLHSIFRLKFKMLEESRRELTEVVESPHHEIKGVTVPTI